MIALKILKSKETIQHGEYKFYKNKVLLSSETKATIILPQQTKYFGELHIIEDKLYLISPSEDFPFLINNKFTGEITPLKINDIVSLESFQFQILDFKTTESLAKNLFLNKETDFIINEKPDLLEKIKELQQHDS